VTKCILCEKPAEKRLTWVNDTGSGVGGGMQGGPMCFNCMSFMDDALSRFPMARDTLTIWPLVKPEDGP
jgi:hypothetical protein